MEAIVAGKQTLVMGALESVIPNVISNDSSVCENFHFEKIQDSSLQKMIKPGISRAHIML